MKIEEVDKNFQVSTSGNHNDVVFLNCLEKPFKIYGVLTPKDTGTTFLRMPESVAKSMREDVVYLNNHMAGGRVKFKTNSPYVAIKTEMHALGKMPHFALTGSIGFDLYANEGDEDLHRGTFFPPFNIEEGFDSVVELGDDKEREITVNFPLYSGIKSLEIGVKIGSTIEEAAEYEITEPVVYYGSSITQGGCASRPGNSYQAILTRKLSCDHINLGFSGNARGDDEMAEYIAGLRMSAFVYDYDCNAPDAEHLRKTHERFFLRIRESHPNLPIIIISMPLYRMSSYWKERQDVIKRTYENALARGDKNVYFIDGSSFYSIFGGDSCTVDNIHPNDIGFMCMAIGIEPYLRKTLKN